MFHSLARFKRSGKSSIGGSWPILGLTREWPSLSQSTFQAGPTVKKTIRLLVRFAFSFLFPLGCAASQIQSQIIVVRGDEDYPPFEMTSDGKLTGVHVDLVNAVAAKIRIQVRWESVPWKRALTMVETGAADGVTYIGRTPEREAWAIFIEDNLLSSARINFIILKENVGKVSFDGDLVGFLEHHTPIALRGFEFGEARIDRCQKLETNNMNQLSHMLKAKRSDVAIVNWSDFAGAFKDKPEMTEIVPLDPPAVESKNYIAFSKARKNADLARRFGDAMKAYKKTSAYGTLLKRYGLGTTQE
jgi:polar amino acid transport system substrate-binding protein